VRTLPAIAAAVAALAAVPALATAKDTFVGFQTPSHGIAYMYAVIDGKHSLRCDVRDVADPPKRPKACELDYGSAFLLSATGRATRLCAGDTVLDPKAKVVPYGHIKKVGPFTCFSKRTGLRCTSRAGHGFTLSRAKQTLF
jgi:hypothetical protein